MSKQIVFLAKERGGSIIEVVQKGRPGQKRWVAVDDPTISWKDKASFAWMIEKSAIFGELRRRKEWKKALAVAATKRASMPKTHGDHTVTVTLTPPQCGNEHDYEVGFKITAHSEPEVTHRAAEDCHPGADAEWEIEQITCEGVEVSFDDLTKDMQGEINDAVTNAVGEIESERGVEDPDDARDRERDRRYED